MCSAPEVPSTRATNDTRSERITMSGKFEKAILAGGCFWGMQDLIRKHPA